MALAGLVAVVAGCGGDEKTPAAALAGDLKCTGSGSPTVILESGLGVEPTTWGAVIPNVSGAQVCVHQRPGTGSSPPAGIPARRPPSRSSWSSSWTRSTSSAPS
jgi:hypothetical protein